MIKREAVTNNIVDDLNSRNENWDKLETMSNQLETEYAPRLTNAESNIVDLQQEEAEHSTRLDTAETNINGLLPKVDLATIDTQTGVSVRSKVADDSVVEITKIEGATTVTPANPDLDISPDNVATITSAKDFDVVACGKNLLPNNWKQGLINNTATNRISAPLFFLSKGAYCYTNINTNLYVVIQRYNNITDTYISSVMLWSNASVASFTLNEDSYIFIACRHGDDSNILPIEADKKIQIELGSTSTAYEPYKSNKITIPFELRSLPNGVKDTIEYIGNGKGKLVQRVGEMVLDGSEDEGWLKSSITDIDRFFISRVNDYMKISSQIICTHFTQKKGVQNNSIFNDGVNHLVFNFSDYGTTTLGQWRTFLQANPVTVQYELAEPIETIIDLPPLVSYKGITNVYTTAMVQPKLTVDFKSRLKNTTEILLTEIAKLKQAIISLGGTV